jgi:hypothetical protein
MGFSDDIRRAAETIARRNQQIFVDAAVAVHDSIVHGSAVTGAPGQPVDTGYLRASWQIGWDGLPAFPLNGLGDKKDPGWREAEANAKPPAGRAPRFALISTNAVYAEAIEDNIRNVEFKKGGGHSVILTIASFGNIVAQVDANLKGFADGSTGYAGENGG